MMPVRIVRYDYTSARETFHLVRIFARLCRNQGRCSGFSLLRDVSSFFKGGLGWIAEIAGRSLLF